MEETKEAIEHLKVEELERQVQQMTLAGKDQSHLDLEVRMATIEEQNQILQRELETLKPQ